MTPTEFQPILSGEFPVGALGDKTLIEAFDQAEAMLMSVLSPTNPNYVYASKIYTTALLEMKHRFSDRAAQVDELAALCKELTSRLAEKDEKISVLRQEKEELYKDF